MLISRKKYNTIIKRLVLAERVAEAALERDYESTREARLWREVHEIRYDANKSLLIFSRDWIEYDE